jgi:8-oxo-dGTP pyrophosphatase MutT (NUDIX family)
MDSSRVLLCLNDRGEWELPGGRLEHGEDLESCVEREVKEETGLTVRAGQLLHAWSFEVLEGRRVVVIAYECRLASEPAVPQRSEEHDRVSFVPLYDLDQIDLPGG